MITVIHKETYIDCLRNHRLSTFNYNTPCRSQESARALLDRRISQKREQVLNFQDAVIEDEESTDTRECFAVNFKLKNRPVKVIYEWAIRQNSVNNY